MIKSDFLKSLFANLSPSLHEHINRNHDSLFSFFSLLQEHATKTNLLSLKKGTSIWLKDHFADSLEFFSCFPLIHNVTQIIDIGSGAGFPGLCLALLMPEYSFYLFEPRKKRAQFIDLVKKELALSHVHVMQQKFIDINSAPEIIKSQPPLLTHRAVFRPEELWRKIMLNKDHRFYFASWTSKSDLESHRNLCASYSLNNLCEHALPYHDNRLILLYAHGIGGSI